MRNISSLFIHVFPTSEVKRNLQRVYFSFLIKFLLVRIYGQYTFNFLNHPNSFLLKSCWFFFMPLHHIKKKSQKYATLTPVRDRGNPHAGTPNIGPPGAEGLPQGPDARERGGGVSQKHGESQLQPSLKNSPPTGPLRESPTTLWTTNVKKVDLFKIREIFDCVLLVYWTTLLRLAVNYSYPNYKKTPTIYICVSLFCLKNINAFIPRCTLLVNHKSNTF